jgi:hypothetical protein
MASSPLETRKISDLVRTDVRVVRVLVDLGISPRYLHWTVNSVAEDRGISVDLIVDALTVVLTEGRRDFPRVTPVLV